jgi:hypothetical protein
MRLVRTLRLNDPLDLQTPLALSLGQARHPRTAFVVLTQRAKQLAAVAGG